LSSNRLGDVTIRVQVVALVDVLLGLGGGQNHHRDALEVLIGLHFGENFAAIFLGQVEVQQHQAGTRGAGMFALAPEEGHGLLAVAHHVQIVAQLAAFQGFAGEVNVAGIIFDKQNFDGSYHIGCMNCHLIIPPNCLIRQSILLSR
jgi:hypothetical protein